MNVEWLITGLALMLAGAAWLELGRRRELVARACHELRGPLTAAGLALHAAGREREASTVRLAAVENELARAARALDDLGAARRGRRAGDRDEEVAVDDLLVAQAAMWAAVAASDGRRLRLAPERVGVAVRADRVRLAQAVANLLANAIEHGAGTVELGARLAGGGVRIEVRDEGRGLPGPVALIARRRWAGLGRRGRGLAIAAGIASRYGGRLVAAPAARGARVAIELPVAPAAGRSPGRRRAPAAGARRVGPVAAAALEQARPQAAGPSAIEAAADGAVA